jgi:RNA polymerase sigma factor (sigma-70 family)
MQETNIEQIFREGFESYSDELFRHAFFRVSDREKAVEMVQDTYLKAWEYVRKGEHIRELRPFLYRTLRHLIIDEYRRKKSVSLDAMLENEERSNDALMSDEVDALSSAIDRLDGAQALARVADLPPHYSEVILLRFVEGLSPGEIATRIDISENLVAVRIHRALKALKELLEPTHNHE